METESVVSSRKNGSHQSIQDIGTIQGIGSMNRELLIKLSELHGRLKSEKDPEVLKKEVRHLRVVEFIDRFCFIAGIALAAWMSVGKSFSVGGRNFGVSTDLGMGAGLLAAGFLISLSRFVRWTMIAHHVTHRGYDRNPYAPKRFKSKVFAKGWRRWIDWNDWIVPMAWDKEHNLYHHYSLGEEGDPDRVEVNLNWLRERNWPRALKVLTVMLVSTCWKAIYYAPNTLLAVKVKESKDPELKRIYTTKPPWISFMQVLSQTMIQSWIPYIGLNFILLPLAVSWLVPGSFWFVLSALLIGEVLTNIHSFFVITPNHAGDDMLHFESSGRDRYEFYRRQILSSVNYRTGGFWNDLFQGYLNYQIEHHLFPELSMWQYQKIQPQVQKMCEEYRLNYLQHSIFKRIYKTVRVMIGDETNQLEIKPISQ